MAEIMHRISDKQASDVEVVTLVHRKDSKLTVDKYCFEIGDEWIIGCGLDDNGLKRNYRNIYSI
jgi:hypoxanthine-guanine phosphoribosyltransferase